jgi:hypothetical protein
MQRRPRLTAMLATATIFTGLIAVAETAPAGATGTPAGQVMYGGSSSAGLNCQDAANANPNNPQYSSTCADSARGAKDLDLSTMFP